MVFLIPREEKFFDMFDEVTAVLGDTSTEFLDLVTHFDRIAERADKLKDAEHKGDLIIERIIKALDRSFVTPLDREDIHRLATSLDDVIDNMEETAQRMVVFRLEKPTLQMIEMAQMVHDSCTNIVQAVKLCRKMKDIDQLNINLREIGRIENEADRIYRDTDTQLFANPPEILTLIKYREIYQWLEETVDACRDVAQVISEIVIKGS